MESQCQTLRLSRSLNGTSRSHSMPHGITTDIFTLSKLKCATVCALQRHGRDSTRLGWNRGLLSIHMNYSQEVLQHTGRTRRLVRHYHCQGIETKQVPSVRNAQPCVCWQRMSTCQRQSNPHTDRGGRFIIDICLRFIFLTSISILNILSDIHFHIEHNV